MRLPAGVSATDDGGVLEPTPADIGFGEFVDEPPVDVPNDQGEAEGSDITPEDAVREFQKRVPRVRLVRDVRTGTVDGIAIPDPETGAWRVQRAETPTEAAYQQLALRGLTEIAVENLVPFAARVTSVDEAVTLLTGVADPSCIALKMLGAAAQAVARAHGLGSCAPLIGTLVEQTLKPVIMSDDAAAVAADLQIVDVAADAATGQFTAAVYDYAGAELDTLVQRRTRGISQAELDRMEQTIRAEGAAPRAAGSTT